MTVSIYTFAPEWYEYIVKQKYPLRSMSQAANRPWGGGQSISGPHTQLFLCDVTFAPMRDPVLQDLDAFFTRARGRANVIRIAHAMRLAPWYDRNLTPTRANWSDNSTFSDGSGFVSGYLPPEVYVETAAARGSNFIVLGGFPASISNVIRKGDPFEIKPNGVPAAFPHRYKAMFNCSSDASGRVGIEIEPKLRAGVAAGDTVGLRYASSVFRMTGDDQFEIDDEGAGIGNFGGSLVEALDLVP